MANILKPSKLNLLWASGGDILDPGDTKYQTGWGVEVPPRQWENYIQNKQDQAIAHINQHGIAVWDAETEYQADTSYSQGATNGTIYRAKVTHFGQNPELDTLNTYWDIAFAAAGDFYTKAEVDADFLAKDQNLGDLPNVATARTNLNIYSKTETYNKTEVDGKTVVASLSQAQEGVANNTLMTPLRTEQWAATNVFAFGQTYQNVTGSRVAGVEYSNTTGKSIQVLVSILTTNAAEVVEIYVGTGLLYSGDPGTANMTILKSFVVPDGLTYRVTVSGGATIARWVELR